MQVLLKLMLLLYHAVLRQSQVEAHENRLLLLPLLDFILVAFILAAAVVFLFLYNFVFYYIFVRIFPITLYSWLCH